MNRFAEYENKKKKLVEEFRQNLASKGAFSLEKKTSNLFRNRFLSKTKKLNVQSLNQVISIDPVLKIAEVEAMTPFETLVNETLKLQLLPPVVPELKTITVGGALVGLGIESSSFRYGLVHETILEIEVLTGDGKVVVCNGENEHRDLFFAFPNSYGTLGIALKVKMKLIEAKPFMRLSHFHFDSEKSFFSAMQTLCEERRHTDFCYIDGVIFSPNNCTLTLAEGTTEAPYTSNYKYLKIYYQSIRSRKEDYLSTLDYIWRWDPDWFWCSKHFGMQNKTLRLLFGKWMLQSKVYWKIKHLAFANPLFKKLLKLFEKPSESVIQDILIPIQNAPVFADFLHKSIGITPIWICPYFTYQRDHTYTLCQFTPSSLMLDFGFWDVIPSKHPRGHYNRLIEEKTEELRGYKSLYSDSFYSEEKFWQIHPKNVFFDLKNRYDKKNSFKNLYEKCVNK